MTPSEAARVAEHVRTHGLRWRLHIVGALLWLMEWVWPWRVTVNLTFSDEAHGAAARHPSPQAACPPPSTRST